MHKHLDKEAFSQQMPTIRQRGVKLLGHLLSVYLPCVAVLQLHKLKAQRVITTNKVSINYPSPAVTNSCSDQ